VRHDALEVVSKTPPVEAVLGRSYPLPA
jgi:hypothetical protein